MKSICSLLKSAINGSFILALIVLFGLTVFGALTANEDSRQSNYDTDNIRKPEKVVKITGNLENESTGNATPQTKIFSNCDTLSYFCNVTYGWPNPNIYNDDYYSMKFTVEPGCTLREIGVAIYGPGTTGTPNLEILLWADDGFGFPDLATALHADTIPYDSLLFYPDFNVVDLNYYDIIVSGDFHVGWSIVGDAGDTLTGLSDDGSCGTGRSNVYWDNQWWTMSELWDIDVNFLIEASFCCPEEEVYSIEQIHDSAFYWNDGRTLTVTGFYTGSADRKLITDYGIFLQNCPGPSKCMMALTGVELPPEGGYEVNIIGQIDSVNILDYPYYPQEDTLNIYFNVSDYEIIDGRNILWDDSDEILDGLLQDHLNKDIKQDPCRHAILISGGINSTYNYSRYWNKIEDVYQYLIGDGYDPDHIHVIYYDGNSDNTAVIPHSRVQSATMTSVTLAFDQVAAEISSGCGGTQTSAFIFTFNHGDWGGDLCLLGTNGVSALQFRNETQKILNAGCDSLYVLIAQCFGGVHSLELKNADNNDRTIMFVTSNAHTNVSSWSTTTSDPFIDEVLSQLLAGENFEVAMVEGLKVYYNHCLALHADPHYDLTTELSVRSIAWKRDILWGYGSPTASAWNVQASEYGFQSGKFEFFYENAHTSSYTACGNSELYERFPAGWVMQKHWNWNVPGSAGYGAGNELRIWCISSTSTGEFKFVSQSYHPFIVTASYMADPSHHWKNLQCESSVSNIEEYGGFVLGWYDRSPLEFGEIYTPIVYIESTNTEGFNLSSIPREWGIYAAQQLNFEFAIPEYNEYWTDMLIGITPSEVTLPGSLYVSIPSIGKETSAIYMDNADTTYTIRVTGLPDQYYQSIIFDASQLDFQLDCMGINTLVVEGCCAEPGDADHNGTVNILDITLLISYLYKSGSPPFCYEEGDANGNGTTNILDITHLIAFLYKEGPAPVCP